MVTGPWGMGTPGHIPHSGEIRRAPEKVNKG
jgi:hypothetical protein